MLNELLQLLPDRILGMSPALATGIASTGAVLALIGARFGRAVLALSLVALGTLIGLRLPGWMGWGIDPMGTAFGAAIVLGISGFVMERFWEAVLLGVVLAAWAAALTWISLAPGQTWTPPVLDSSMTMVEIGQKVFASLPATANWGLLFAAGIGLCVGLLLTPTWPRMGRVMLYVIGGLTTFVLSGAIALRQSRPVWMTRVPADSTRQVVWFVGVILIASGIQWLLLPRVAKATKATTIDENPAEAAKQGDKGNSGPLKGSPPLSAKSK